MPATGPKWPAEAVMIRLENESVSSGFSDETRAGSALGLAARPDRFDCGGESVLANSANNNPVTNDKRRSAADSEGVCRS